MMYINSELAEVQQLGDAKQDVEKVFSWLGGLWDRGVRAVQDVSGKALNLLKVSPETPPTLVDPATGRVATLQAGMVYTAVPTKPQQDGMPGWVLPVGVAAVALVFLSKK